MPPSERDRSHAPIAVLALWLGGCAAADWSTTEHLVPGRSGGVGDGGVGDTTLTVVHDEYFHPTSWSIVGIDAANGATQTALQGAGELGNSGFYRRMVHDLPAGGRIAVTHRLLGYSFEPRLEGALLSIDLAVDATLLPPVACGSEVEHRAVLFQDGVTFYGPRYVVAEAAWTPILAEGLEAEDFRDTSGRAIELGARGGPIEFGFERRSANAGPVAVSHAHGLANLDYWLHHE